MARARGDEANAGAKAAARAGGALSRGAGRRDGGRGAGRGDRAAEGACAEGCVIVTGISGNLGRRLARRLHREHAIIGIDRRPLKGRPKDIQVEQIDIRRRKCEDIFRRQQGRIRAVFHTGTMHDPRMSADEHHSFNVVGTTRLLSYCERYGAEKVIFLSSADVYGPRPQNDQFLTEDTPLLAGERFHDIRDLVSVDQMVSSFFWKHPEIETVLLRPVHIVGGVNNALSTYLRLKRPPTLLGFDPMIQLIHVDDVIEAMVLSMKPGVRGIFNLAGPGQVPLSAILRTLGRQRLPVPHPLAAVVARVLWKTKILDYPEGELDYLRFVCMVDGSRAADILGFKPKHTMEETILAVEDPFLA